MIQHVDGYGRKYNPDRDIVHLYQNLARAAFCNMARDRWGPVMSEFAKFAGVEDRHLNDAAVCLAKFVATCKNPNHASFGDAWAAAGFEAVPPAAIVAVMWHLGVEATGAFYKYAREAFPMHQNAPGTDFLQDASERLLHLSKKDSPRTQDRLAEEMKQMLDIAEQDAKVGKT